jgi:hypothetical protein
MAEKDSTRQLRELHRYTWEIVRKGKVIEQFHMDLLPETYAVDEPARVSITQTRGAGFVDIFGFGYGSVTMSGTTGFTQRPNPNKGALSADTVDGFERWTAFRDFFTRFFQYVTADPGVTYYMHHLNWTQDDYFIVWPTGKPQLQRNVQQPLLYRYSLTVTLIGRLQKTAYIQDQRDKTIEELATQGPKRVGVIAAAIDSNLADLWTDFAGRPLLLGASRPGRRHQGRGGPGLPGQGREPEQAGGFRHADRQRRLAPHPDPDPLREDRGLHQPAHRLRQHHPGRGPVRRRLLAGRSGRRRVRG